ncbi:MAG: cell wall hydrolase [Pseudolabrys sp.]
MGVVIRVLHKRRAGVARVGAFALAFTLVPTQPAYQGLGALLAHQPGVAARARAYLIDSPFGTIHTATFSLPRPVGTAIPHPPIYALANFDPGDIARSIGRQFLGDPRGPRQFPTVNRRDKRDSLISRARAPMPPMPAVETIKPLPQAEAAKSEPQPGGEAALPKVGGRFDPYSDYEFPAPVDDKPAAEPAPKTPAALALLQPGKRSPAATSARVYFGADPLAALKEKIKPWAPGRAPVASGKSNVKLAALIPTDQTAEGGVSVASKGEVTGAERHPQSPAERLSLTAKGRAKAEKCLADAVYFEARGEPVRGQIAVAQVVMNRVFSAFYPDKICGVVYQGARRHLACQFTFACDGVPDVVTEPNAWLRAKRIAHDMLAGKLWLPEIGKATHYHASWVHPDWVSEMRRIYKLGVHTFYRPRAWGNGASEPRWSDPKTTAKETKIIKKL